MVKVLMSFAQSLDGCIATKMGESKWISQEGSLKFSQDLRAETDAILVGSNTVLVDNPKLTCRIKENTNPLRVILDSYIKSPIESNIFQDQDTAKTVIFHSEMTKPGPNHLKTKVKFIACPLNKNGNLNLLSILKNLEMMDIKSLYIEGGAGIITSFLKANLVDELYLVTAPIIIGNGIKAVNDIGVVKLSEAIKPRVKNIEILKDEVIWHLILKGN